MKSDFVGLRSSAKRLYSLPSPQGEGVLCGDCLRVGGGFIDGDVDIGGGV